MKSLGIFRSFQAQELKLQLKITASSNPLCSKQQTSPTKVVSFRLQKPVENQKQLPYSSPHDESSFTLAKKRGRWIKKRSRLSFATTHRPWWALFSGWWLGTPRPDQPSFRGSRELGTWRIASISFWTSGICLNCCHWGLFRICRAAASPSRWPASTSLG